jgi:ribosomal protein S1
VAEKQIKPAKISEPKTMAELLAMGKSSKSYSKGDYVKAKVTAKTSASLVLDIGGKSEGLVTENAFLEARDFIRHLEIGDEVVAKVIIAETPDGYTILSLRNAAADYFWKKLIIAYDDESDVMVSGKAVTPSGLLVEVYGISAFIPMSHVGKSAQKNLQGLIDKSFPVKVIEVDKEAKRIVLSEKYVSEKTEIEAIAKALKKVKPGDVYEGKVTTVADFGIFVEFPVETSKVEGLVHVSELSWEKVAKPQDKYSVGDKVKVVVVGIDRNKISLSIKQTSKDPWEEAAEKYKSDQKLKGTVVKQSDFGIFVKLEPGIEGLVHITKVPPGKNFSVGDEINVYIEEVDVKSKKISLGLVLTEKPVGYK